MSSWGLNTECRRFAKGCSTYAGVLWLACALCVTGCTQDGPITEAEPSSEQPDSGAPLAEEGEANAASEPVTECVGDPECQRYNWPRVLLAVIPEEETSFEGLEVTAAGIHPSGNKKDFSTGDEETCEDIMYRHPQLDCTSYFSPGEGEATIRLRAEGMAPLDHIVMVGPHNYCGAGVLYVVVAARGDRFEVQEESFIYPCTGLRP